MKRRPNRIPLIGKFSIARCVWAPQYASLGTLSSPRKSFSMRWSVIRIPRRADRAWRSLRLSRDRTHRTHDAAIQRAVAGHRHLAGAAFADPNRAGRAPCEASLTLRTSFVLNVSATPFRLWGPEVVTGHGDKV